MCLRFGCIITSTLWVRNPRNGRQNLLSCMDRNQGFLKKMDADLVRLLVLHISGFLSSFRVSLFLVGSFVGDFICG